MTNAPTLELLEKAKDRVNADPGFRGLGTSDMRVGLKVDDRVYSVEFEAFSCCAVAEVDRDYLRDMDFYLEMDGATWGAYAASLGTDEPSSVNGIDLDAAVLRASGPLGRMKFAQYNLTLDAFLKAVAGAAD